MVNPKLTSVRQPLAELADAACELLLRRMNGDESDYPKRIRLKPSCNLPGVGSESQQQSKNLSNKIVDYFHPE